MTRATVRVELHADENYKALSPTAKEYDTLHAEMHRRGFLRYIETTDGTRYHLPPAEYSYDYRKDDSQATVARKVAAAAKAAVGSDKRYSYLITETTKSRKRYRLQEIEEDPDA